MKKVRIVIISIKKEKREYIKEKKFMEKDVSQF